MAIFIIVIPLSIVSTRMWGGKPEQPIEINELSISSEMTVREFGKANSVPNPVLKKIFDLQSPADLETQLAAYGTPEHIADLARKNIALAEEHASKNWMKIPVKFGLWLLFLTIVYFILRDRSNTTNLRKWLYVASIILFGVIMGSDPSPMGTVKDAIHLFGTTGAVFIPRMIALAVFLILVFWVNKYICAWGCQVGTIQDLIFRINRSKDHRAVVGRQVKVPFVLTNSIRVAFLFLFTIVVLLRGTDIIEPIDPFKIYNPVHIGIFGGIFIGLLLIASLFVYRPWCHFFCPFGLVGWLIEKVSLVKISVDYEACIACEQCTKACPSTVMEAILKRKTMTIPDCFSCYTCRDVCPTDAIHFSGKKRTVPPADKFN